jgi:hypothetical protein
MNEMYSLKDAAAILQKQPYQIVYLLTTGKVAEPERIGGKRVFTVENLTRIAERLGIENIEELLAEKRRINDQ